MSKPPSRPVKLGTVPNYLEKNYLIVVTRQTVYNWVKTGKKGTKLQTITKMGQLFTQKEWIDEFVRNAQV